MVSELGTPPFGSYPLSEVAAVWNNGGGTINGVVVAESDLYTAWSRLISMLVHGKYTPTGNISRAILRGLNLDPPTVINSAPRGYPTMTYEELRARMALLGFDMDRPIVRKVARDGRQIRT